METFAKPSTRSSLTRSAYFDRNFEAIALVATITFATCGWVILAGKDVGWDVLNHHLYLPFSLLTGRFRTDLFAAGPQSYQNPLGYILFYGLVRAELPDWTIAVSLTVIHASAAFAIYRIAIQVWGDYRAERFWRISAISAAWISPAFLIVVGTSSLDPLTNSAVLWSLCMLLHRDPQKLVWRSGLSGALLGFAFSVKQSNAVFVISIGLIFVLRTIITKQATGRQFFTFGAALFISILVLMGGWSAWLWQTFENPLFPLFNDYFQSPYAPSQAIAATRFLPNSVTSYLWRPFEIAQFKSFTNTEAFTPDIRPLALLFFFAIAAIRAASLQIYRHGSQNLWRRSDVQLTIFTIASYLLWLKSSGNSRYAIPLFFLCGLLLVRACQFSLPLRMARLCIIVIIAVQFFYYASDGNRRFSTTPWTGGDYFNTEIPPILQSTPFLHVSLDTLTSASVAPFLNKDGAMMNVVGQISLPTDGKLGIEFHKRMTLWEGRTRLLFRFQRPVSHEALVATRNQVDAGIYRIAKQVDWSDCEEIKFEFNEELQAQRRQARAFSVNPLEAELLSCKLVPLSKVDPAFESQRKIVDLIFERLELLCPKLFAPRPFISERPASGLWARNYINTDTRVSVSFERGIIASQMRSLAQIELGSISNFLAKAPYFDCSVWNKAEYQ